MLAYSRRQRQLERQRTRAQGRLAEARERLERPGWLGRRRRTELQAEIALYRTALRLADEKLNALRVQPPRRLQPSAAPPHRDHELVPTRSRQPRLEQEPQGLGLER